MTGQLMVLAGVVLVIAYYLFVWWRWGRDPEGRAVVVRYEPPRQPRRSGGLPYDPGTLRFISRRGWDGEVFTAAVLGLLAKGYLRLTTGVAGPVLEVVPPHYELPALTAAEKCLYAPLQESQSPIRLDRFDYALFVARKNLKEALRLDAATRRIFVRNLPLWGGGLLLSLAVAILAPLMMPVLTSRVRDYEARVLVWLLTLGGPMVAFLLTFTGYVLGGAWAMLRTQFTLRRLGALLGAVGLTLFVLATGGSLVALGAVDLMKANATTGSVVLLLIAINILFFFLLQVITRHGRRLLEEIEGFRRFLEATEADYLAFSHPPKQTPQVFARFYPYAVALGIEQGWARRFSERLSDAAHPADDAATGHLLTVSSINELKQDLACWGKIDLAGALSIYSKNLENTERDNSGAFDLNHRGGDGV